MGIQGFTEKLKSGWEKVVDLKDGFVAEAHNKGLAISPFTPQAIIPQVNTPDDETWGDVTLFGTAEEIADKARKLIAQAPVLRPEAF